MRSACRVAAWSLVLLLLAARGAAAQDRSRSPHGALPAGLDCTDCHTNATWKPLRTPLAFDHDRQTRFPLQGQHARAACQRCHLDAKFDEPKLAPTDCGSCHVDVHQGKLGPDCATCHAPTRFRDVNGIGLHVRTGFPLTGAHLQLACSACHTDARNGAFTALDRECYSCHRKDYEGATTVDHVTAGFPKDCRRCHGDLTWQGGVTFDHLAASAGKFALLGAHAQLRCASCHVPPSGTLKWTPSGQNDCVACHQADYDRQHGGSGFPTTCLTCHTVNTWNTTFDHGAATGGKFTLIGAHTALACSACHVAGSFQPRWTPSSQNDCITCHQPDYDQAHTGSGFPTTCLTCHTASSWSGASFRDHDAQFFPIYSGAHAGQWSSCATCHTTPSNYAAFTCLSCHTHDQATTDSHHTGVSGYSYNSQACYSCHPQGRTN